MLLPQNTPGEINYGAQLHSRAADTDLPLSGRWPSHLGEAGGGGRYCGHFEKL